MRTVAEIVKAIEWLYITDALHVKRGFPIRTLGTLGQAVHFAEEAVEFQAAALLGDHDEQLEEAADTLMNYVHLLRLCHLDFDHVVARALDKLNTNWTTDPNQVTAKRPGLTRAARKEGP